MFVSACLIDRIDYLSYDYEWTDYWKVVQINVKFGILEKNPQAYPMLLEI